MDLSTGGTSISYITAIYISAIIRESSHYRDNPSHLYFANKVGLYSANLFHKVDLLLAILVYSSIMEVRCTLSIRETQPGLVISLNLEKALLHFFLKTRTKMHSLIYYSLMLVIYVVNYLLFTLNRLGYYISQSAYYLREKLVVDND